MQTKTFYKAKSNLRLSVWNRWLQSSYTEEDDFNLRRTINAPTWADLNLLLQKELISKVYSCTTLNAVQLNGSFHQYWEGKEMFCTYVRARVQKGVRPITNHSPEMNKLVFYRYWNDTTSFNKAKIVIHVYRAIFVWMKKNEDLIKMKRKQSYNKNLIRRLTSQCGCVFSLVKYIIIIYYDINSIKYR